MICEVEHLTPPLAAHHLWGQGRFQKHGAGQKRDFALDHRCDRKVEMVVRLQRVRRSLNHCLGAEPGCWIGFALALNENCLRLLAQIHSTAQKQDVH